MTTNAVQIAQNVIEQLHNLDQKISRLLEERAEMKESLEKLKTENKNLESRVSVAVSEINDYLKELEEIKAYYVNSNNNNQ
jgi:archaellum component FlaC